MALQPEGGPHTKVPALVFHLLVCLFTMATAAVSLGTHLLPPWALFLLGLVSVGLAPLLGYSTPPASPASTPSGTPTAPGAAPPAAVTRMLIFLALFLAVGAGALESGCSLALDPVEPQAVGAVEVVTPPIVVDCAAVDLEHRAWTATSAVGAGIASALAVVLPIVPDDTDTTIGIAVGIGVAGIVAGLGTLMASDAAKRWAEWCATQVPSIDGTGPPPDATDVPSGAPMEGGP